MFRKLASLVIVFLVLGLCGLAQGTDYYVSPSGSDSNPGTSPEQAWATLTNVNTTTFVAGDSISFEGGQTFYGSILLDSADGGTATSPVVISSYGTGRATIDSADANGLYAYNCAGFEITNLIFAGSGNSDANGDNGLLFYNDLDTGVKLDYVLIDNLEIRGYFERGIYFLGPDPSASGYSNVTITNCEVHDCGNMGINSDGPYPFTTWAHENFYVGDCVVYDISGIPGRQPHSGSGIVLSNVDVATIEFCEAYNTGWLCDADGGGPLGIWGWECNDLAIQYCESHHNKTSGGDGGGFDLDGGCINSVMQYNYSHDNEGCSYLICHFGGASQFKDNVCRYNIGENDCTGSRDPMGAIHFWSGVDPLGLQNTHVYNNTIYLGPNSIGKAIFVMSEDITGLYIRNNIFVTTGGLTMVEVLGKATDKVTFQGNCYWSSGDDFIIKWGRNKTYTSLDAWRSATDQEMVGSTPVGFQVDPLLTDAGGGGTIGDPHLLATLEAYKLTGASPLIDGGLDLEAEFGTDVGTRDFYGTDIPNPAAGAFDVGAHEYDQNTPVDTTPPSPDPMTWATVPYSTGESSISMTATTASDESGVQYYFECVSGGGNDSGWRDNPEYEDTGLSPSTQYSYRVQARDKSPNQNTTGWSTTESATTDAQDLTPPSPDPMTWAVVPYAIDNQNISMTATTATDDSGVEYYFECTAGGGNDSGWQDEPDYTDTGLTAGTEYSYRVQARDKSANQNATGFSTTESATTDGGALPWYDGFESGDFIEGGWTVFSGDASVSGTSYTGEYGAKLIKTTWIEKAISTEGFTQIHVKYARKQNSGMDEGEYLFVEWWDGTDWNELERTQDTSWVYKDFTCSSGADDNPNFKLRFRTNCDKVPEVGFVDDVEITGTSL